MEKTDARTSETHWKSIYLLGGAAALVPVVLGLLDIGLTFLPAGAGPEPGKGSVLEWFTLLQTNGSRRAAVIGVLVRIPGPQSTGNSPRSNLKRMRL